MFTQTQLERDFEQHLTAAGKSKRTVMITVCVLRQFLKHVGDQPLDRVSEDSTRAFFARFTGQTRQQYTSIISRFLNFATSRLPVVLTDRGSAMAPGSAPKSKKEIALRQRWSLDKLVDQKNTDDDLIAKLARKVIDHYLYFQGRMKGEPENLDDVYRFADECKELIESNLPLFMNLSAGGRNVHSAIDERVKT